MKVISCTSYPHRGGAGIAAARLAAGLNSEKNVDCKLIGLPAGRSDDANAELVLGTSLMDRIWQRLRKHRLVRESETHGTPEYECFFSDLSCYGRSLLKALRNSDVVHFHWMCDLLDYSEVLPQIPSHMPVVWTMHDMAAATGGCYHPVECSRFRESCGACPQLHSEDPEDLSARIWSRKQRAFRAMKAQLTLVAPSHWIATQIKQSGLLGKTPCRVIRNPIDLEVFCPADQTEARKYFGIPKQGLLVVFVAASIDNPLKGMPQFIKAAEHLRAWDPSVRFATIGELKNPLPNHLAVHQVSATQDPTVISRFYAAADVMVIPSLIENLPNVVAESLACGTPAVGFRVGGIPELIQNGVTGQLARRDNASALSEAAISILETLPAEAAIWSKRCREFARRELCSKLVCRQHLELYSSLIS